MPPTADLYVGNVYIDVLALHRAHFPFIHLAPPRDSGVVLKEDMRRMTHLIEVQNWEVDDAASNPVDVTLEQWVRPRLQRLIDMWMDPRIRLVEAATLNALFTFLDEHYLMGRSKPPHP